MKENDLVPGSGLFTRDEIVALAFALGTARDGQPFTTNEVCKLIEAASDARITWEIWKGVIDGVFVVDIVDGEFVFDNSPATKKQLDEDDSDPYPYPDCPACGCVAGFKGWCGDYAYFLCLTCGHEFSVSKASVGLENIDTLWESNVIYYEEGDEDERAS